MEILDKQGKWWQAKKADGSVGSKLHAFVPSCVAHAPRSCTVKLLASNMICTWTLSFRSSIYS